MSKTASLATTMASALAGAIVASFLTVLVATLFFGNHLPEWEESQERITTIAAVAVGLGGAFAGFKFSRLSTGA